MKKWLKILLKTLGVIIAIIIIVLIVSINHIDNTPYFETEYYKTSVKNINNALSGRELAEGKLKAGFAKTSITPKIVQGEQNPEKGEFNKIKLSGFGDGKYAKGVHDTLYAKAIAIDINGEIAVLVSADILIMPPEVADKVGFNLEKNTKLNRQQIFFGATHTHASLGNVVPSYVGKQFGGEYQPELIKWLTAKFTNLIEDAVADMKPAQIASGYIHVPNLVTNRIIGETGRLNDKLTLLSVKQDSAKSAVIGIFAAHATTISSWNDKFSGDYPGYFQRALESKGFDMAMFYAGTVGSHTNKGGEGKKFERPKVIGEALADSAMVALKKMKYKKEVKFSRVASEIEIPKLQFLYIKDNLRLAPFLAQKLFPEVKKIYLQSLRLNNFIWITMPYELSGEYAIDLKNALALKGFNSAMTSFNGNGQHLGYIVPAKYYYFDAYEARLMGWYGPSMGDYLMELKFTLANGLAETKL